MMICLSGTQCIRIGAVVKAFLRASKAERQSEEKSQETDLRVRRVRGVTMAEYCKGTTLTTLRPPLSSGLLRRIYVFHYYHLIHVLTFIHFLLRPSPTFGDVAVHIPFLIPSLHIVPFPFSMIPHPSETCPTVS